MKETERREKREELKLLLGLRTMDKDELVDFALAKAEDLICGFCGRCQVPAGLYHIHVNLALDLYRSESFGSEEVQGAVKQITEGDTTVTFASAASSSENAALAFLKDYKAQLTPYRKLGW